MFQSIFKYLLLIATFSNTYLLADTRNSMDEQTKIFLEQINSMPAPPMETLPIEEVRRTIEQFAGPSTIELASISNIKIPGPQSEIPLRIYTPKGKGPFPVFINIHGGGWVFGSLNTVDHICRSIAEQARVIVVSIDYRLAPEHKYPAGLNDCYAAVNWVASHIQEWNGDPSRLAIGGDSSGGNLAAAVTLMLQDRKMPLFKAQVLIYPVMQHRFNTTSYQKYSEGYFLTKKQMEWIWNLYLAKDSDGEEPYASPLFAKNVSGLPPALIVLAEFDPLYDEGLAYGKKLEAAHVPVVVKTYPTIHVFVSNSQNLDVGKQALSSIAQFLREKLYGNR